MRKIVATTFISLDGVMQAPGGPHEDPTGGFRFGGWTVPYWDDSLAALMMETFKTPFDLLLGRKTYDIFAAYWPYVNPDASAREAEEISPDVARIFNRATKYVATRSPRTFSWQNTQSLGGNVVARLHELKRQDGPMLLVQGSSDLLQTLLAHDLVDTLRLLIYPVVLGSGKRLFGAGAPPASFRLTHQVVSKSGVIVATYERAGPVTTGSFAAEIPSAAELERRKNLK